VTATPYDPSEFPPFAVTVDIAVFTLMDLPVPPKSGQAPRKELAAVLIVRGGDTEAGRYALPGGFVHIDEDLSAAALRELHEEAGLELPTSAIHQFRAYGDPDRDPRMRVVTVAHTALTSIDVALEAGTDAKEVEIVPVRKVLEGEISLAFDHDQILRDALEFVQVLVEETSAILELCPESFTLTELRHACEAVWGFEVDRATFNKRVLHIEGFLETDDSEMYQLLPSKNFMSMSMESSLMETPSKPSTRGRPAKHYRRGWADTLHPPLLRPRDRLKETESWYENVSLKRLMSEE
jgi:8-oxo-dGTP diphosphatase